jgi:hypothetical protein
MKTTDVINALKLIRQTRGNIKCEVRGKDGEYHLIQGIEIRESDTISKKTGKPNLHVFIDSD